MFSYMQYLLLAHPKSSSQFLHTFCRCFIKENFRSSITHLKALVVKLHALSICLLLTLPTQLMRIEPKMQCRRVNFECDSGVQGFQLFLWFESIAEKECKQVFHDITLTSTTHNNWWLEECCQQCEIGPIKSMPGLVRTGWLFTMKWNAPSLSQSRAHTSQQVYHFTRFPNQQPWILQPCCSICSTAGEVPTSKTWTVREIGKTSLRRQDW